MRLFCAVVHDGVWMESGLCYLEVVVVEMCDRVGILLSHTLVCVVAMSTKEAVSICWYCQHGWTMRTMTLNEMGWDGCRLGWILLHGLIAQGMRVRNR